MLWLIVSLKPATGDVAEVLHRYANKGHALAKLRGLRRAAWRAASEMEYAIRRGGR